MGQIYFVIAVFVFINTAMAVGLVPTILLIFLLYGAWRYVQNLNCAITALQWENYELRKKRNIPPKRPKRRR